jgi:6-phosphogluconolactonase
VRARIALNGIRVFADLEGAGEAAAALLLESLGTILAAGRSPSVVLAGGTTPRGALERLSRGILARGLPVHRVRWLFGDERWVARSHPRSNEGMARETLLAPVGAPQETIASWDAGTGDPVAAAGRYAVHTAAARAAGGPDIVLLGMGADGHTASLFPGAEAAVPGHGLLPVSPDLPGDTAAVYLAGEKEWRLTLCPVFLNRAALVVFLVDGQEKAGALGRVLDGDRALPASWITGGRRLFLVTERAAPPRGGDFGGPVRSA